VTKSKPDAAIAHILRFAAFAHILRFAAFAHNQHHCGICASSVTRYPAQNHQAEVSTSFYFILL